MSDTDFRAFPKTRGMPNKTPQPVMSSMTFTDVQAVEQPGFVAPMAEPSGISLALPSRFVFYNFKDTFVKPFKVLHLAKLSKAHEDRSLLPMVEAVSSVLSTSTQGVGPLGFELCVADFYFVLYWLKLNSFTKSTLRNISYCTNPKHIQDVEANKLSPETLKIQTIVTNPQLNNIELTELPSKSEFALSSEEYFCRPATMRDTLEFLENPDWQDAEFQYLAKLASNITTDSKPPLQEKIEAVKEFSPDDVMKIQKYEQLMDSFGIDETIKVTCKVCGASRTTKLSLDAHSFLSTE